MENTVWLTNQRKNYKKLITRDMRRSLKENYDNRYSTGRPIEKGDEIFIGQMVTSMVDPEDKSPMFSVVFFHQEEMGSVYRLTDHPHNATEDLLIPVIETLAEDNDFMFNEPQWDN